MFANKFSLLLALVIATSTQAAVVIKGQAPTYPDQYISAFQIDDYLSGHRILLQTALIQENGSFEIRVELNETQKLILGINNIEAELYAEPNHAYTIDYPSYEAANLKRFDRTEVQLSFVDLPSTDLNALMRSFDSDLQTFWDDHYYDIAIDQYRGSDAYIVKQNSKDHKSDIVPLKNDSAQVSIEKGSLDQVIDSFINGVNEKYQSDYANLFFAQYVRYSIAQIELISGKKKGELYHEYFMSQKVQFANPAYFQFFGTFYTQVLTGHETDKQFDIYKKVNAEKSASLLMELFANDSLYISENIRALALIKGLQEVYYNKDFSQAAVSATLESMATSNACSEAKVKEIAKNVRNKFARMKAGWVLEDFTLLDEYNEKWTYGEHDDKYTYFIFFANWCSSCIKEMQILEKMAETYKKDVQFVAISMDSNYADYKNYLQSHLSQKYTFLFGGTDPLIREKFNVRSLPFMVLTAPSGAILNDYTRKPSEGINLDFEKIKALSKKTGGDSWNGR